MFLGLDFPVRRARERNAIASPFELVQSGLRPMREDTMHHENPRSESGALVAVHLLTVFSEAEPSADICPTA